MSLIKLKNITHAYEDLVVLDHVSLEISKGEVVSIIGPSGCGKTTLLKIITGILNASEGQVAREISQGDFGVVFQNPTLLPWRTVVGNVQLPQEIRNRAIDEHELDKLLTLVGIESFKNYYPSSLSGGMKQRVALARSLSHGPAILVMDEPFGSLDELTREELNLELLRIQRETGKTIIFVTHSLSEAVFISDRVIVLSHRPAKVVAERTINLPRDRIIEVKASKEYREHLQWLRVQLQG